MYESLMHLGNCNGHAMICSLRIEQIMYQDSPCCLVHVSFQLVWRTCLFINLARTLIDVTQTKTVRNSILWRITIYISA